MSHTDEAARQTAEQAPEPAGQDWLRREHPGVAGATALAAGMELTDDEAEAEYRRFYPDDNGPQRGGAGTVEFGASGGITHPSRTD